MNTLNAVTTEDLRDVLAEVEGKKPTQWLMVAINYREGDDTSMKGVDEWYGYIGPWRSQWLDQLEQFADEPFEQVIYDEPRSGRATELADGDYDGFSKFSTTHRSKLGLMPRRGQFHSPVQTFVKSSLKTHRANCVTFRGVQFR